MVDFGHRYSYAAWAAGGMLLASQAYGVKTDDPQALGATALLRCGCALVAGLIPAGRASRVDPMQALRSEWLPKPDPVSGRASPGMPCALRVEFGSSRPARNAATMQARASSIPAWVSRTSHRGKVSIFIRRSYLF